jgi:hypothetical protein
MIASAFQRHIEHGIPHFADEEPMKPTPSIRAEAVSRQHLLRRLLEQLERTFTMEGHASALQVVTDLLERLDDDALRAYAYQHGVRSEDEFEEEAGPERIPTPTETA